MTTKPTKDQFGPRVRFNWGYWDARADRFTTYSDGDRRNTWHPRSVNRKMADGTPYNRLYVAGYKAGWVAPADEDTSSEPAWVRFQSDK